MATDQIEKHPEPPPDLSSRNLPLIEISDSLFRIHRTTESFLFFGKTGDYRFDAERKEFGVMYLSTTASGAFVETLWKWMKYRAISQVQLLKRNITVISLIKNLILVDLTSPLLLSLLNADARLATGDFYGVCRRWSSALNAHPERIDGILYPARHDITKRSIALYDRAERKLATSSTSSEWLGDTGSKFRAEIISTYNLRTV